ncbi:peptide transporter family 1 isoform X2 [Euwallacea similis]|uniref:peptide transporter family 1 isoform X2 n=1 Tax=Euwallacea similis TaxID=1736056 RepID=UPI00344FCDF5
MAVDKERQVKKLPYPKSVFFIVSNEFCERFSFYGMRTILILYLTEILFYPETSAKMIYHGFTMFVYFFPLLGAIISDSWLGKFRTILYISIIYAIGSILLSLTAIDSLKIPQKAFTIISLLLIAMGTGGIKPCVSAFGGDQFILPQQDLQLVMFFSFFYFSINAGSLLSTFITPLLRNNVECFGNDSCYPLAFAIPGILMVISIFVFASGKPMYRIKKPKGNVFVNVVSCMWYAATHKKSGPVDHWLDRAEPKYGAKLVSDIKSLLKVLVIYIPIPVFWALYDQQGSGWTFQAVRMNGNIGFYTILPDQMQVVNPLLILAFIPLFTYGVYPVLAKCNLLTTPLQRLVCGGFLAAIAFGISALVSLALERTYPTLPSSGEAQIRMYDTTEYNCTFTSNAFNGSFKNRYFENTTIKVPDGEINITFNFISESNGSYKHEVSLNIAEAKTYGIYLDNEGAYNYTDNIEKSSDGYPLVRTLVSNGSKVTYTHTHSGKTFSVLERDDSLNRMETGSYDVNGKGQVEFKLGGTYTVLVTNVTPKKVTVYNIIVTDPNSIHMLWLLIQYVIITAAEIMFSITGLEFAYSQAPISMKSVLQACWLLTTAFGNLLIVVIESFDLFELQSNDFFLYTGLMVVDVFLLMWLTIRYKYVTDEDSSFAQEDEDVGLEDKKVPPVEGVDNLGFDKHN